MSANGVLCDATLWAVDAESNRSTMQEICWAGQPVWPQAEPPSYVCTRWSPERCHGGESAVGWIGRGSNLPPPLDYVNTL